MTIEPMLLQDPEKLIILNPHYATSRGE
jgi:hypothetical protein